MNAPKLSLRIVGAVTACMVVGAAGPGFDCKRATSALEQTICTDPALAQQDSALGIAYALALKGSGVDGARLRLEQLDWLRYRDAACGRDPLVGLGIGIVSDNDTWRRVCLSKLYETRIETLKEPSPEHSPPPGLAPLCDRLIKYLPPTGSLVNGRLLQILQERAGQLQVLDSDSVADLRIEHLYSSAGVCPAVRLSKANKADRSMVALPDEADSYCGSIPINEWPTFSLAAVDGQPALVTDSGNTIDVTPYTRPGWGKPCSIRIVLTPAYAITRTFCTGPLCGALSAVAPRLADLIVSGSAAGEDPSFGLVALWNARAPAHDAVPWQAMLKIGLETSHTMPFPTIGQRVEPWELSGYFDDQSDLVTSSYGGVATPGEETAFVPMKIGGELLLGKIGAAGFGCCHVTADELLSIYRVKEKSLVAVAAFVLQPNSSRLAHAEAYWSTPM